MAHIRRHPGTGKWQVRYRDPTGRERSRTFRRKADADSYLTTVEADKLRGEWRDPSLGRRRFDHWATAWSASRIHLRPSTIASTASLLKQHVLPYFGDRQVVSIEPSTVQAFVSRLQAKGLSRSTIRNSYLIIRGVLDLAIDEGALPRNACRGTKLPLEPTKEMRFLSAEELDHLVQATPAPWHIAVLLGGFCGLRFSEVAGLRLKSVDMLKRQIRVLEAAVEVNGIVHFGPPKSRASARAVAAPRFVSDALAAHLNDLTSPEDLLFHTASGGPISRANFRNRVWLPAVHEARLEPLRFHDLRHTHAALLIAQGEHPKVIQTRLGHSSIRVTLDTYGHLFDGMDDQAALRLDELRNKRLADLSRTADREAAAAVVSLGTNP